jgi:excisionase family DNA binding protein
MDQLCITVEEMGKRLGVGRVSAYALAHSEGFPSFRVGPLGGKLLVSVKGLEEWVAHQAGLMQEAG